MAKEPQPLTGYHWAAASHAITQRQQIMGERPFLYAKFLNGTDGSVDFSLLDGSQHEELFYTDDDPWQMHNVFANASAELRAALRAEVERWWTCSGDACP